MGWSRRDEEWRADYERDSRKHDTPSMTPQQRATEMLQVWQLQRVAGVPAADRRLPSSATDDAAARRDIEIIQELLERK